MKLLQITLLAVLGLVLLVCQFQKPESKQSRKQKSE